MSLNHIDIRGFRNLISVQLTPTMQGINLIHGNNGSGKTSFLEAIYYLSRGRSFRSSSLNHIICNSSDNFSIFAQLLTKENQSISLGIERQRKSGMKIRLNGKNIRSVAEIADLIPMQLINFNSYSLLDGGPIFRRKYIDWGSFYFAKDFLALWQRVNRALMQRNIILRNQRASRRELDIWTLELIESAMLLDQFRQEYVERLRPVLIKTLAELIMVMDLEIGYYPGWSSHASYEKNLEESLDKDKHLGYTLLGPHKADLKITINKISAKDILSRGQQKLFICAMIVAQGALLFNHMGKKLIYMVDDLSAELDMTNISKLTTLLIGQEAQVFLTSVESEIFKDFFKNIPLKLFHVEHGAIAETCSETFTIRSELE